MIRVVDVRLKWLLQPGFFHLQHILSFLKARKWLLVLDDIDDMIEFVIQAVEQIHDQGLVAHWSINILEQIGDGLQALGIFLNRKVTDFLRTKVIVQLDGSCFFIVSKLVFDTKPHISSCTTRLE